MWRQVDLARLSGGYTGPQLLRGLLRLALFFGVEGAAELCRRHLLASLMLPIGMGRPVTAESLAITWAYLAHGKLAFRDVTLARRATGWWLFLVLGWGCLDVRLLALRLAPGAAVVVWAMVESVKFALVRRLIWLPCAAAFSETT